MLVLTGQGSTARLHKESHQIMDVVGMFEPVTKWATTVYNASTIPEIVRKAVRVARSEKPGAVHIELPEDIAKHEVDAHPMIPRRFRRSVADDKIVDRAFELIAAAHNPVILAGNGTIRRRASKQLRKLCDSTGIGVLSTFMAKGAFDMDADYCLYTIGLGATDIPTLAVDAADLVITLGFDMVEYHPRLWNPNADKTIIHADFLPAEIDEYYHPEVEIIGDLAHTLWMLNQRLHERSVPKFDFAQRNEVRKRMSEEFALHADDDTEGRTRPQKTLWDVRSVMGPEDILLSDVGAHKMWIARHYQCHEPNTYLIPNGFCSMGFALPGAIAASMADPDRKVIGIAGDAGFMMNVQEMETAKRLNTSLVMVVWEDREYGLIAWKQESQFGRHTDLSFTNPDWLQLSSAFGWNGHIVERSRDFAPVLAQAFAESGASLIVVPVDYRENMLLNERLGELTQPSPIAG